MTPAERGECGSRGRGCQPRSRAAPGQKRPAGTTTGLRATSPAVLGRPGVGNTHPYLVPSQEVRELELSGGVRSLPQVPWWNAGRRARPKRKGGASRLSVARPVRRLRAVVDYASAGVPLPFFFCTVIARSGATKQSSSYPLPGSLRSARNDGPWHRCLTSLARAVRRENGIVLHVSPLPEVAAKRPSKGDGRGAGAAHPSRLASLAPQDDGWMLSRGGMKITPPTPPSAAGGRRGSSGRRRRRCRRSSGKIRYAACGSRNCRGSRRESRR